MKHFIYSIIAISFSCFISTAALAAEQKTPDTETIKKAMEINKPGQEHSVLDGLVGKWNYTVTFQMAPDAPTESGSGTSVNKWILDGRFVEQTASGTAPMGADGKSVKYEGKGLIGHDNVKKEYFTIWADNMNTAVMNARGTYDEDSKTITESGIFYCPIKGEDVNFKSELKFVDANNITYTTYDMSGNTPFKSMVINYKRKK